MGKLHQCFELNQTIDDTLTQNIKDIRKAQQQKKLARRKTVVLLQQHLLNKSHAKQQFQMLCSVILHAPTTEEKRGTR